MIGPKKLSTIRQEVEHALAATSDDPIRWLEERMTTPVRPGSAASGESEILHSLRRVLEGSGKRKQPKPRVSAKK